MLAYMGEAAFLSMHKEDPEMSFYRSIPESIFWPVFVVATLATIVASQPSISATFSLISQCRALNCFPRVKIIHTSNHVYGQIYIPEINWILMLLCLFVTMGFKDTQAIGNAYGLTVISVMFVTTCLMFLIITTVWNRSILLAILFTVGFGSVEFLYLSACLSKFPHGGWFPFLLSLITLSIMATWHYGASRKQDYELQNKVKVEDIVYLSSGLSIARVPGICFVFSSTPAVIPPMFAHFFTNFPAFHSTIIFVGMHTVPMSRVPLKDKFFISQIGPKEWGFFGCVVRNGYKDSHEFHEFEDEILDQVVEFLLLEGGSNGNKEMISSALNDASSSERVGKMPLNEEVMKFLEQREVGVTYMVGHTFIKAHSSSSCLKKFMIDLVYGFLRRNCRRSAVALGIPHSSLIEVGVLYKV